MKTKTISILAAVLCGGILSLATASCQTENGVVPMPEPSLTFTVPDGPRTAGMCGPSHDEEMIYGLGSDGRQHYFAVGTDVRGQGITIWQSEDMVNWKDVGKVFTQANKPKILNVGPRGWSYDFNAVTIDGNGEYEFLTERKPGANNYRLGGAQPFWAPCIFYHEPDKTYYLYYSCSAYGTRNSFIGCAKSKTIDTGWEDCGQLIHTRTGDGKKYNAIDPTVFRDANGRIWMIYGSFFGGIAIVELNPENPAALLRPGTHGTTIACRGYEKVYEQDGFEGKQTTGVNGEKFTAYGIEGASIVYNPKTEYYYLFVSYDRLAWTYHVRVGRSKNVEGPYLDFNARPLVYDQERQGPETVNGTKIIGPYRWKSDGAGWAATGHTTLFYAADGSLMFGSNCKWQGNPGSFVGLRKVFWSPDGWPMLSPAIYGGEGTEAALTGVDEDAITAGQDAADWDFIVFSVTDDTTYHRTDESTVYTLGKDGSLGDGGKWEIDVDMKSFAGNLRITDVFMYVELPGGVKAYGKCAYAWDQDRRQQTVVFTGLTADGVPVWGQRGGQVLH